MRNPIKAGARFEFQLKNRTGTQGALGAGDVVTGAQFKRLCMVNVIGFVIFFALDGGMIFS